jgi:hypothetical protein
MSDDNDNSVYIDFLRDIQDSLTNNTIDQQQRLLLLQFYTKSKALKSNKITESTETEMWDYLTLGIYFYEYMCSAK